MAAKVRRKQTGPSGAGDGPGEVRKPRDEAWDERLRHVGDARFVEVEWSGRDHPCWPLAIK
ncbi:MAG: hypothetical protein ACRECV_14580 [Xanthobacteraceae bacterium]